MFVSGKNPEELVNIMNAEMIKIINWLRTNKLSLNLKKTHFIIFRKKRGKITLQNDLIIDDVVINRTNHTRFLGVMVDQHLTFESHVKYIKGKISRGIGILYKAKRILKESSLLTLYYAFIYPYFTYCITVWGNTYPSIIDPLIRCQKRAVRIVKGVGKYDHTSPIFYNLKILNLRRLYVYFVEIFLYKYKRQELPESFKDFFTVVSTIHQHNTRQISQYRAPLAICFQRSSALKCSGAKITSLVSQITPVPYRHSNMKWEILWAQCLMVMFNWCLLNSLRPSNAYMSR